MSGKVAPKFKVGDEVILLPCFNNYDGSSEIGQITQIINILDYSITKKTLTKIDLCNGCWADPFELRLATKLDKVLE